MGSMVVSKTTRSAIEEIRGMHKSPKETDLIFLTRVVFSYKTAEKSSEEKECVVVFLGSCLEVSKTRSWMCWIQNI